MRSKASSGATGLGNCVSQRLHLLRYIDHVANPLGG